MCRLCDHGQPDPQHSLMTAAVAGGGDFEGGAGPIGAVAAGGAAATPSAAPGRGLPEGLGEPGRRLLIRGGAIERLENEHLPLGVLAEERYESRRVPVRAGDLIACYTDGLTETADKSNRQFGIARVDEAIQERADRTLAEIIDSVLERVRAHGPQGDDQSMLLVRIA